MAIFVSTACSQWGCSQHESLSASGCCLPLLVRTELIPASPSHAVGNIALVPVSACERHYWLSPLPTTGKAEVCLQAAALAVWRRAAETWAAPKPPPCILLDSSSSANPAWVQPLPEGRSAGSRLLFRTWEPAMPLRIKVSFSVQTRGLPKHSSPVN